MWGLPTSLYLPRSDLVDHYVEEKHLSACPDLSCAHLGGHLNLYAHFLESHYTPRPAQPAPQATPLPNASPTEATTAAGTAEAEEAAKGVKEREEEEKERKKERAVAEAGAFLQWLRDHGVHTVTVDRGELHPTAAVLQEQVCGFVAVFQATEGTAALAARLSEDDIASVYAYTLETEMYRRVCTCTAACARVRMYMHVRVHVWLTLERERRCVFGFLLY